MNYGTKGQRNTWKVYVKLIYLLLCLTYTKKRQTSALVSQILRFNHVVSMGPIMCQSLDYFFFSCKWNYLWKYLWNRLHSY